MSGMQFAFNPNLYNPSFGGGGSLPPGKYKVVISDSAAGQTKDGQGGYLALTLKVIDGPLTGGEHIDRLNLHNASAQAVQIAHERLAGYCVCTGVNGFQNTAELHNKPFSIEVGPQKDDPQYTEVKKLFDVNGNTPVRGAPGAAAQPAAGGFAPQQQPQQQQPQQQQPAPGFAPGQPAQQPATGGGWPAPANQPANGAPAGGAPWGGAPAGQPAAGGGAPWGR